MPKPIALTPSFQGDKWVLNLPAAVSPSGKRARKYFPSEKDAKAFAEGLKKQQAAGIKVASRANPDLIRDAVDLDERLRLLYGLTLREAVEELMRRLDLERRQPTFLNLLEAHERDHSPGWEAGSRQRQAWFRKQVEGVEIPAGQLFQAEFWSRWLNETALAHGWSDGSFNAVAGMLSSVFEHGVRKGLITFNPAKGVKRRKVRRKARAVLTVDQAQSLMNAAWAEKDKAMVPYFALAIFAGLRPADTDSEISNLTWEDINWEEGWIRVGADFDTKTETKRFVHIEDNLRAWLEPFKGRTGPVVPMNLRRRRTAVIKAANVPWGKDEDGNDIRDISRHTYGSYLEAKYRGKGNAYAIICENMGHTSIQTYQQYYRNARTRAEGEAFWAIMPPA